MKAPKLFVIGKVFPEPNSSAAGYRILQLISLFQNANWEVHFACVAKENDYSENLIARDIQVHSILLNDSSFDKLILELQPNMVLFDRYMTEEQFGWRVAQHCPNAVRVLDTEDLHGLRTARENALKLNREFNSTDLFNVNAYREIASLLRCDLSLIISQFEMQLLKSFFKIDSHLLFYLPFLLENKHIQSISNPVSFLNRQNFVFIGNFLHAPNSDAVMYLNQTIWPLLRNKLPQAELHIYGAYADQKIKDLHSKKNGFIIKGRTEDVNKIMKTARVNLAPLRYGAGLKGKVLDAMLNSTPTVCSSIAAEGMTGDFVWPGKIEDEIEKFVDGAKELYENEEIWNLASGASQAALAHYSSDLNSEPFMNTINNLQIHLNKHRAKNFMGALLQHEFLSSSKYKALWIESKNRENK